MDRLRKIRSTVFPDHITEIPVTAVDADARRTGFIARDVVTGLLLNFGGPETEVRHSENGLDVRTYLPMNCFVFLAGLFSIVLLVSILIVQTGFFEILIALAVYLLGYRYVAPRYHAMAVENVELNEPLKFDNASALDVFRTY